MIKLREILHTIKNDHEDNLVSIDDWKISNTDFLNDMGFKPTGVYHFSLNNPKMQVCCKRGVGFILDDGSKNERKEFKKFEDLIDYFSNYQQKQENESYL